MRDLSADELAAIARRVVEIRSFVWVVAKTRESPISNVGIGFWTDAGVYTCDVIDALTGSTDERSFNGGAIVSLGHIPLVSDFGVRAVDIKLSAIDPAVEAMVRTYDVRGAPVQIYRGFFNPDTHELVAPARARFVGFIDAAPIATGAEGEESSVTLSCASHTRELTRKNSEVRSHESQLKRSATDTFYKDTSSVGDWEIAWGEHRQKAKSGGAFGIVGGGGTDGFLGAS
jgi:hypothetical protein